MAKTQIFPGSRLLNELTQSKVDPSVPFLSRSEHFSHSAFMNAYTRRGVSTFGEVSSFGDNRLMNLWSRSSFSFPSRVFQPTNPAKVKRMNKRVVDTLVNHFLANSKKNY